MSFTWQYGIPIRTFLLYSTFGYISFQYMRTRLELSQIQHQLDSKIHELEQERDGLKEANLKNLEVVKSAPVKSYIAQYNTITQYKQPVYHVRKNSREKCIDNSDKLYERSSIRKLLFTRKIRRHEQSYVDMPVHRIILASQSRYFDDLFNQPPETHVSIHNIVFRVWSMTVTDKIAIQIVIEWLYIKYKNLDKETSWNVLLLAQDLEIHMLASETAGFILDQELETRPIQSWFLLGKTAMFDHNYKKLLTRANEITEIQSFCAMIGLKDPKQSFIEYVFISQFIFYRDTLGYPFSLVQRQELLGLIVIDDWREEEIAVALEDDIMPKNDLLIRLGKIHAIHNPIHELESRELSDIMARVHDRTGSADTLPDDTWEDLNDQTVIYAPVAQKAQVEDSLPQETGVSFGELTIQLLNDLAQKHSESRQSESSSVYETPDQEQPRDPTSKLLESVSEKLELLSCLEPLNRPLSQSLHAVSFHDALEKSAPLEPLIESTPVIDQDHNLPTIHQDLLPTQPKRPTYLEWTGENKHDRAQTLNSIASAELFHVRPKSTQYPLEMPGSFTSKRSITPSNPLPQIPNGITKMGPLPPQRGLRTLDLEKQDRRRWTVDYAFEKDRDVKKKKSILDFFTQFV